MGGCPPVEDSSGTDLLGFVDLDEQLNMVFQGTPAQTRTHLDAVSSELAQQESLEIQYLNTTDETQRAGLQNDYAISSAAVAAELAQLRTLRSNAKSGRESTANGIVTANANLASTDVFTSNQKSVNTIQLQRWNGTLTELGASEVSTLEQIAYQCPLEGGNAVHRARAMLRGIGEYNFLGTVCVSAQARQDTNSGAPNADENDRMVSVNENANPYDDWKVYPNPTNAYFRISGVNAERLVQVELYDLSGKQQQNWTADAAGGNYRFSRDLPGGVYVLHLHLRDGERLLRRLVVSR